MNHPDQHQLSAYTAGTASAEARAAIEEHCIECDSCRGLLALLLTVVRGPTLPKEIAGLLPIGMEAAAEARAGRAKPATRTERQ